jgi:hypothetical protein
LVSNASRAKSSKGNENHSQQAEGSDTTPLASQLNTLQEKIKSRNKVMENLNVKDLQTQASQPHPDDELIRNLKETEANLLNKLQHMNKQAEEYQILLKKFEETERQLDMIEQPSTSSRPRSPASARKKVSFDSPTTSSPKSASNQRASTPFRKDHSFQKEPSQSSAPKKKTFESWTQTAHSTTYDPDKKISSSPSSTSNKTNTENKAQPNVSTHQNSETKKIQLIPRSEEGKPIEQLTEDTKPNSNQNLISKPTYLASTSPLQIPRIKIENHNENPPKHPTVQKLGSNSIPAGSKVSSVSSINPPGAIEGVGSNHSSQKSDIFPSNSVSRSVETLPTSYAPPFEDEDLSTYNQSRDLPDSPTFPKSFSASGNQTMLRTNSAAQTNLSLTSMSHLEPEDFVPIQMRLQNLGRLKLITNVMKGITGKDLKKKFNLMKTILMLVNILMKVSL